MEFPNLQRLTLFISSLFFTKTFADFLCKNFLHFLCFLLISFFPFASLMCLFNSARDISVLPFFPFFLRAYSAPKNPLSASETIGVCFLPLFLHDFVVMNTPLWENYK